MKTRYKFLRLKGKTIISDSGDLKWKIGEWQKVDGELNICNRGLHCSKSIYDAFSYVQGEVVAKVEVRGKHLSDDNKECWEEMRIIEAKKWKKKDSVALAIFSAELVLENFEKKYPTDLRPREAIEAAKKVLFKDTAKNRAAAKSAAWSAARSAAWSAAWSAALSAESAALSAESAAWSAALSAESAAESAESAWSAESALSAKSAKSAAIKKIGKFMEKQYKDLEVKE